MTRRAYIDWLRGLAVAIMIEAHTIDSWITSTDKGRPYYHDLPFLAGWAAPLFLFLAGVAIPLAAASKMRRGLSLRQAGGDLQVRGWQIFGLAFAFRVYSFLLGPGKMSSDMLKPDILNVMGLAMVGTAYCWSRTDVRPSRLWRLALPALAIVVLTPLAVGWTWPSHLPPRLEAYVRPNGSGTFALLPWAAFVFAGAIVGDFIARARTDADDTRLQVGCALAGGLIAATAYAGSFVPSILPHSSFWTTSPSWFCIRAGVATVMLPLAWLWMKRPTAAHWSPMLLFGRTSLFVYWIHVEIVYGFLTYPLRSALSIEVWFVAYVVFTALLLGAAALWLHRSTGPLVPAHMTLARDSA
jgi:uncharacterized membrane protein